MSLKVTENGTIGKLEHGLILAFHSHIFSRFNTIHKRDRCPARHCTTARAIAMQPRSKNKTVLRECKPPMPKFQPKVIWSLNSDCWINPDPDVCRISPKCCEFINLSASVISPSFVKIGSECTRNADKSPKIPYSAVVRRMER